MNAVHLFRISVHPVTSKLYRNIGSIKNCYRRKQVYIPLYHQVATNNVLQDIGQSVTKLVEQRISTFCTIRSQLRLDEMSDIKPFERLPRSVHPKHYSLALTPDLKLFTFDGEVTIHVEVTETTDTIVLNSLDLNLKEVSVASVNDGARIPILHTNISVENETVELKLSRLLDAGDYSLSIVFTGEINDKMKGLYRSKYISRAGEEKHAAVTQFEATDARRCFPCWDEPAIKATFDISLIVPEKLEALSNMPVRSTKQLDKLMRYDFERTPVMSTYLVAAVVGEYDYVEDRSSDGVLVRVYTPRGKKTQGLFALEVATKVLPYYKDYFNIAYPLPKIDLIAIADFSAGAMENWGLVTYRETCLLVDPENTSAARKQWIALVVGHELAHQWFGNLVTMEWWTHLWLNEGYASFVEFLCVNHLFPEYDIWTQFVTDMYIRALELDCLKNSHPIEVPVGHPSEIDEIFDDISYNKGASVIRMLHNYIGDDDFRKGMHLYLTRHQYKSTYAEDLWAALEEASAKPVGTVMSTWIKKMGFPVVTVSADPPTEGGGVTLTLKQQKFCADINQPETEEHTWMIPISISTSNNPTAIAASIVLTTKEMTVTVDGVSLDNWIKVNPGTVGFYRTQYPSDMLARLIPAIRDKSLPPLDRLGLLDDLFAMVQAGHTSTVEVLKLMQAFEQEDNYTVWSSIGNCLSKLSVLLSHTKYEDNFKHYERKLLSSISERLGWDPKPDETHLDTLLRGLVLGRLVWLDDVRTVDEATKRFEQHIGGGPSIPADLRNACYKAVLRAGDIHTYDRMLRLYRSADLHEEKNRISQALGAIKDKEILYKVLEFAMSEEVRSQDTVFVIMSVAMTRTGRELAWQFFKDNWAELMNRYQGGFLLARLVKFTTENFADEAAALEVEAFFKEHKSPGTERTVQQSLESIRRNAAWLARDSEAIGQFLTETL